MRKENLLTLLIVIGLAAGVIVGQFVLFDRTLSPETLQQRAAPFQQAGDLVFIRPLMMLIIPLVFLSVVTGVTAIGDPSRLGLVGGATLLYFLCTTALAVVLGLAIVNVVGPGKGVKPTDFAGAQQDYAENKDNIRSKVESGPEDVSNAFLNVARDLVPTNLPKAAVDGNILGVVFFAILLGIALAVAGPSVAPGVAVLEALLAAVMKIVGWVMWLAPLGVFLIIAARVGSAGLNKLVGPLGLYILCVVLGLLLHGAVVLPLVCWIFGRTNPYAFSWRIRRVLLTAFGTASSAATLPVTIETCKELGGCSKRAATFVPALGATVNMNGTALYESIAVVFLFQVFGDHLTLTQQLIIAVTATLSAIGAPGIPAAGLVTMAIVINAVNSSIAATSPNMAALPLWTIGIIYGVDRFLDMCRTTVNVFGDAIGARIITRIAPDDEEERAAALA